MTGQRFTSIIMVTYFTGSVLDKAIDAVLAQTSAIELVLVNNGNQPSIEATLAARAKNEPRIKWVSGHGNIGFGRACNLGAKLAIGDFILFLNPDSVMKPDTIAQLLLKTTDLKQPTMLGVRLLDEDGKDQRGCRRALLTPRTAFIEALHLHRFFPKDRLNLHEEPLPKTITPMPAISGAFMFMPKDDFWLIGGFDEDYFLHVEDLDLCLRFRRAGGEIYFVPAITVTHIGGTSTATSAFLEKNKAKGFSLYFHKNFSHEYSLPLLWLLDTAIWFRCFLSMILKK